MPKFLGLEVKKWLKICLKFKLIWLKTASIIVMFSSITPQWFEFKDKWAYFGKKKDRPTTYVKMKKCIFPILVPTIPWNSFIRHWRVKIQYLDLFSIIGSYILEKILQYIFSITEYKKERLSAQRRKFCEFQKSFSAIWVTLKRIKFLNDSKLLIYCKMRTN